MPRTVTWFPRLYPIHRSVASSARSHYDRREIEALFEIQPRAAQMLMGIIDGIRVGRSQLVDRAALEAFLSHLIEAADPAAELRAARRRVKQRRSRRLRVQLTPQVLATTFDSLPASVTLTATRLSFEGFASANELLQQLWAFISALQNDEEKFRRVVEGQAKEAREAPGEELQELYQELEQLERQRLKSR